MDILLMLVAAASMICLIIGLYKPILFEGSLKNHANRKVTSLIFGGTFLVSVIIASALSAEKVTDTNAVPTNVNEVAVNTAVQADQMPVQNNEEVKAESDVSYEVVNVSTTAGNTSKTIVISKDLFNEDGMKRLGAKLNSEDGAQNIYTVNVFDDKQYAEMMGTDIASKSETVQDAYLKHFVGQYTKNPNSKLNEMVIYFDGYMGVNSKTISY